MRASADLVEGPNHRASRCYNRDLLRLAALDSAVGPIHKHPGSRCSVQLLYLHWQQACATEELGTAARDRGAKTRCDVLG